MSYRSYPAKPHPMMRCGQCNGPLRYEPSRSNPDSDYGSYTHAGPMMDRHGAWPVEIWSDTDAAEMVRWESWRPPSWDYPPLPGVAINPEPPEPPIGVQLASSPEAADWLWEHPDERGWRMRLWDEVTRAPWSHVLMLHRGRGLYVWAPGAPAPVVDETEER